MMEMLKDLCYHPGSSSGETFQKEKKTRPLGVTYVVIPSLDSNIRILDGNGSDPTLSSGEKGGCFLRTLLTMFDLSTSEAWGCIDQCEGL